MKKPIFTLSLLLAFLTQSQLATAQLENLSFQLPEGWEIADNWISPYHNTLGSDANAAWIADKIADGALLLVPEQKEGFILLIEEEADAFYSTKEQAEAPLLEGRGTQLLPLGEAQPLNNNGFKTGLKGTIAGHQVNGEKVCLYSAADGLQYTLITVFPKHEMAQDVSLNDTYITISQALNPDSEILLGSAN